MTHALELARRDLINGSRLAAHAEWPKHDGLNWFAFAHVDKYSPDQTSWAERQLGSLEGQARQLALSQLLQGSRPEDGHAQAAGNLLVTEGLNQITSLIINSSTSFAFTNTKGLVTVGDSATAAAIGDTYVTLTFTAGSNCYQNPNDATFPNQSNGVITSQSTYGSAVANFAWACWGWASFNGTAAANATLATHGSSSNQALLLNHKVAALGTKGSGASWVFTTTITLS